MKQYSQRICPTCGNEFMRRTDNKSPYCNKRCIPGWIEAQRERAKKAGEKNCNRISRTCVVCQKDFSLPVSTFNKTGGLVCSWNCRVKYRRGKNGTAAGERESMKGDKNHNWNGGTSLNRTERNRDGEYMRWKRNVFYRDNYTCQFCGEHKPGEIESHHVFPYAHYKDLRTEVDNGITLCKKCHKNYHKEVNQSIKVWKPVFECIVRGDIEKIKTLFT